jgi:exodeoxyribonuclease-3
MTMKIATYNVNSVRSRLALLVDWLGRAKPDIVCLQEIKCLEEQFPLADIQAAGYEAAIVGQKAYHGVAILSRKPVKVIQKTIGDEQARYLEIEASGVRIINIYAPNGNPLGTEKFTYKLDWLSRLRERMQKLLDDEVPFVVTGDFNIIPEEIDAANPKEWKNDALFQPESRKFYRQFLNMGLTDAFRVFYSEGGHYTFWDYMAGSWGRGNGIRIDHFLLSPQLADRCTGVTIHKDERGREKASDHVPVSIDISIPSKATS